MIKECPTCGRTYSDTTISFCLADGALLSAPFERVAEQNKDDRSSADTAVMPGPPAPKPTQASPLPTMSATADPVRATAAEESSRSVRRPVALALAGVAAIALAIVLGFLLFARRSQTQQELAAAHPSPTQAAQSSAMPAASPGQTPSPTPKPTATPTPGKSEPTPSPRDSPKGLPKPATLDADPFLFPPETNKTDENRIFLARDVDQRVRILSRPEPTYTEEARKNQISGTVILRAVFSSSGMVTNIHPVSGLPNGLTERAIAAAKQIRFTPATKDGRPVSMWMELQYNFNLY